jgi:hypothetical protein
VPHLDAFNGIGTSIHDFTNSLNTEVFDSEESSNPASLEHQSAVRHTQLQRLDIAVTVRSFKYQLSSKLPAQGLWDSIRYLALHLAMHGYTRSSTHLYTCAQ